VAVKRGEPVEVIWREVTEARAGVSSEVDAEGTGVFGTVARAQIVSEAVFSSGVAPSLAHNFTAARFSGAAACVSSGA